MIFQYHEKHHEGTRMARTRCMSDSMACLEELCHTSSGRCDSDAAFISCAWSARAKEVSFDCPSITAPDKGEGMFETSKIGDKKLKKGRPRTVVDTDLLESGLYTWVQGK